MKKTLAVLLMSLWLASCLPTVVGVGTYAYLKNRTQSQYREYVHNMEKINQERKDKGLEPMHIQTFEEWKVR